MSTTFWTAVEEGFSHALSAIVDALEDPSLAPAAVVEIQRSTEASGHIDPSAIRYLGLLGEYDAAVGLIEGFGDRNQTWLVQLWAADSDLVTDPRIIEGPVQSR